MLLEVSHLTKIYPGPPEIQALKDINFSIQAGEILGLLGPNGAGKSTTIKILISTLSPSSGDVKFNGLDIFKNRSKVLRDFGFASAYTNLPLFLTVRENLYVHGLMFGMRSADIKTRIESFLKFFDIKGLENRKISQLSAGQKTRVMLIRAFLTRPRLALLDEPTASLDPDIAFEVRDFILEEKKREQIAVLFTSHNMHEASKLCDRVIFLNAGRIIAENSPAQLAATVGESTLRLRPASPQSLEQHLVGKALKFTENRGLYSIALPSNDPSSCVRELCRLGIDFSELSLSEPSLEDYFISQIRSHER